MLREERGVSEVVGYVLLVGMVVGGMSLVLLTGATALEELRSESDAEVAALGIGEYDSRVTSLTKQGVNRTSVRFSTRRANGMDLRENGTTGAGSVEIRVNGGTCRATVPLSTLRYTQDQEVLAHQAGGVFRAPVGGGSSALTTPPDFTYEAGTVDLSVVNLTGRIGSGETTIRKRVDSSRRQTDDVERALFTADDDCRRPDSVTMTVTTDYADAWAKFLSEQVVDAPSGTTTVTETGNAVELRLEQNALPRAANDSANDVIVLKNNTGNGPSAITGEAEIPVYDNDSKSAITVDKQRLRDGGNNFTVFAEPIANGTQISYPDERTGDDVVYRPPLEVMFVIDGSGSMGNDAEGGTKKYLAAQNAARSFVGKMNSSIGDRGGLVEYNRGIKQYRVDGTERLTGDFGKLNGTIDSTGEGGGTRIDEGMIQGLDNIGIAGNYSHQKVMIVLTDGKNNPEDPANDRMVDYARDARRNGVTVYTIGFGEDGNYEESLLNDTATTGGGKFYAAKNASRLDEVFDDIFADISSSSVIYNQPVGLNGSVGSQSIAASVGDGDDAASIGGGSNVNDPTADAFTISNVAADGDVTNVSAYRYDCAEYRTTNVIRTNSTIDESRIELRCAEVDESTATAVPLSKKSIYLDGEDASGVLDEPSPWWEGNLSASLDEYVDGGQFNLSSNEAIVQYEFGTFSYNGTTYQQRLLLRFEVGVSDETLASDVVDVTVVNAETED
jgi:Mg-chelatase subunit ChlD